jgi:catechol 2,3-dioxygenase-like lactoylglutathione lyase family enzyme
VKLLMILAITIGGLFMELDIVKGSEIGLGTFSVSLSTKDLQKSREFYEKLGFKVMATDSKKFAMMKSGTTMIGLFHGLFEGNGLTFNPKNVRKLQKILKSRGVSFKQEAEEGTGPASAVVTDPDGNVILFDQH